MSNPGGPSASSTVQVRLPRVAAEVIRGRLTYLSPFKMRSLVDQMARVNAEGVAGGVCEFGIALGGSAIVLASLCGEGRDFSGYDVFGIIPPPSDQDEQDTHDRYKVIESGKSKGIGPDTYYGYVDDLYGAVVENFDRFGLSVDGNRIRLVKGLFENTLTLAPDEKVALAHVDCDWFEPVLLCLERLADHMSPGGVVILDDYNDYQGCKKAADQFLSERSDFVMQATRPHAVLQKT